MSKHEDSLWMGRALELAELGRAFVSPNPLVGACVVKNGKLIAEGYHAKFGGPHAEAVALKSAGKKAKGATLYVTLEPCSSWAKTPPCTEAILKAGITRVVFAAPDPTKANGGKATRALRAKKIKVETGLLKEDALLQNEAFFKYVKTSLPFVTLKMAQTLDGKIATASGRSKWISSKAAREFVQDLRLEQDAILVGKNTLLKDNPTLIPKNRSLKDKADLKPWRVLIDPKLKAPKGANVFKGSPLTLVVIDASDRKVPNRAHPGSILIPIRTEKNKIVLKDLLKKLGSLGISKVLVEGGGELAWSFLNEGLVDKINWIIAPKIIGGRKALTSVEGDGVTDLKKAYALKNARVSLLGKDVLYEGWL